METEIVNTVVKAIVCGNCPAFGKKCQKCDKDNHFKAGMQKQ